MNIKDRNNLINKLSSINTVNNIPPTQIKDIKDMNEDEKKIYREELKKRLKNKNNEKKSLRTNPVNNNTFSKLNELHLLYTDSKHRHIHADVKTQMLNYRDCAPEALIGQYDRTKHNVSVHIHPIIAMLFLPKINYIEN
jgi:DNA repair protein RadC